MSCCLAGFWRFLAFVVPFMMPKTFENEVQTLQNRNLKAPKSTPGASKIDPGALQDAIFKRRLTSEGSQGASSLIFEAKMANLAPTWRPKRLQNRDRNLKKSMLKNSAFSRRILKSLGHGFRKVFGRFWGPKIHAKSDAKKNVGDPF